MAGFDMKDYIDVSERVAVMAAKYPDSSLQSELTAIRDDGGNIVGWLCKAFAYRTADDPRPGVGHAFEPVPGKTPYTKDSEAMNAETSAWGRAIVALGFPTKKIASADEVRVRRSDNPQTVAAPRPDPAKGNAKPKPIVPSLETLQDRLLELAVAYGMELDPLRTKIREQQQKPGYQEWLERQITAAESSLKLREEQDRADREAAVETPKFQAPTGRRGAKAAA